MELTPSEQLLLRLLDEAEGDGLPASVASPRLVAASQTSTERWAGPFINAPWFGLEAVASHLEELGLIVEDFGVAEFHSADTPAPAVDDVYLEITDAGRRLAERLRQGDA